MAILRSPCGDGLHSSKCITDRETFRFSFLCSPGFGLLSLAVAVLACFPPGWNDGFHLWRYSGESLGRLLRLVDSPRCKCLGCWATWSPWHLLYRVIASVMFKLRAAPAAASVHLTLRLPGFPRKLRLRGCRLCLRLWILSRRSPLGHSPCSVFHLQPRLLLPYWLVGAAAWELASRFSFFIFLWGLHHSEVDGKGAGMGLPIGLFLFQIWGLPCLRTCGSGLWRQCLVGASVLRDG